MSQIIRPYSQESIKRLRGIQLRANEHKSAHMIIHNDFAADDERAIDVHLTNLIITYGESKIKKQLNKLTKLKKAV